MVNEWRRRINGWRRRRASQRDEQLDRRLDRRLGLLPTLTCRREARAVYIGDGTLLCWIQGRYYLFVPSRDTNITPPLANFGRISPWISRVMAQAVRPGMTVADIGANVGYFTMQLAHQVGSSGRVHAFEPNVELARLVQRSADTNQFSDRVVVHPVPLGQKDGQETWLCVPGDALAGSAIHDGEWAEGWKAQAASGLNAFRTENRDARAVVLQRLDSLPNARDIAFAKIDVEGFEPEVWGGMAGLLSGDALRTVIIEFTPGHYADPEGLVNEFYRSGFAISLIDSQTGPAPIARDALSVLDRGRGYDLLLTR